MNHSLRWIIRTASILLLLSACGDSDRTGIELQVEGAPNALVRLDRFSANRMVAVDTVRLDAQGHGLLRTKGLAMDIYRVSLSDQDALWLATDSTERVVIMARAGQLSRPDKLEGSVHSAAILAFVSAANTFREERDALRTRLMEDPADTTVLDRINALSETYYTQCRTFLEQHANSPAALIAESSLDPERELPLLRQVRDGLRPVMSRSGFYEQFRMKVDGQEQVELTRRMQEEQMRRMEEVAGKGKIAPEIRQSTPDGGTFALSELRGKHVLIDFWASWCKPCRFENPAMKVVYEKYRKKGFEILGVALDQSHGAWTGAIQTDGLPWKHVSDLKGWGNEAAQVYGVTSIPYTVLVDPEGRVIATGLRSAELDKKLGELFGS